MSDLLLALVVLMGLSLVALATGLRVSSHSPLPRTRILAAITLAALLLSVFRYHGTWKMARLLPYSNVIVLGNWIPVGAALLAGITFGQKRVPLWRRFALVTLLLIVSAYSLTNCFLGRLPAGPESSGNRNDSLQAWRSSCGASCAAELLRHYGVKATEAELVDLCLTSYRGTPALGVYRGLKLKTAGTEWNVEVVTCTVEELVRSKGPFLLRILIPAESVIPRRTREGLMCTSRRIEHAVILLGAEDTNHLRIIDPAMKENSPVNYWTIDDLRERWLGEALRLVRRSER